MEMASADPAHVEFAHPGEKMGGEVPQPPVNPLYQMPDPNAVNSQQPQQVATNVPPGLEYLTNLDMVLVKQCVELLEAFTGFETANKYSIHNAMGQQCYYAFEESGCCAKQCCKSGRGFVMKIVDNTQREVIRAERKFNCCATTCTCLACCGCTRHEIVIESPPGVVIGRVYNKCSLWRQTMSVRLGDSENGDDTEVCEIVGPCCMTRGICCMCCDVTFSINSSENGDNMGHLKKQFSGFAKETFTDADNFSVSFPRDLDVRAKAVLLSAVFLVDFLYYEDNAQKEGPEGT